jgi:hypothetical protein
VLVEPADQPIVDGRLERARRVVVVERLQVDRGADLADHHHPVERFELGDIQRAQRAVAALQQLQHRLADALDGGRLVLLRGALPAGHLGDPDQRGDARHPVVPALAHRDHARVRVGRLQPLAAGGGEPLVGLVGVDRLDVPRSDLAVGVEELLVVGERGVVQRDVRLPDVVVVDPALGGADGGEVTAGRIDHPLEGGVQLTVLVGHVRQSLRDGGGSGPAATRRTWLAAAEKPVENPHAEL